MSLPKKITRKSARHGETNDCAVKAIAIVANADYDEVHALLKAHGRKDGKGTPWKAIWATLKALGVWVGPEQRMTRGSRLWAKTVRYLPRVLPRKGRYLVYTRGHILAVVDGEVMDWTEGRRHQPKLCWEVAL